MLKLAATETSASPEAPSVAPGISHAVLLTGAQAIRAISRLLFVLVAARTLGPAKFGVYTLLMVVIEIPAVISGTGYGDLLSREVANDRELGWGVAEQLTWLRFAYCIPLAGIALGVLLLLGYPRLVLVASTWMSLTLFPRSVTEAVQGLLRGLGRCGEYLGLDVAQASILLLGAAFLLTRGGDVLKVVAIEVAAATVAGIAALTIAFRLRTRDRRRLSWRALFRKSFVFNVYPFVTSLYDRIDVVLLSKLGGDYATGIYGAAYRPLGTLQLLPFGILYSLLPSLTRGNCQGKEKRRLEGAMGLLLSAAFFIVLATMIFADQLVRVTVGPRFAEAAGALKILIWAVILRYINYALGIGLLAAKRERVFIVSSSVCLAVNVIGNLIFIPMFSWRAAAVLTVVTEFVVLILNVTWLRPVTGTIPKPLGWARVSLVFATLLIAALATSRFISPAAVGSLCLLLFVTYLYRTGMVSQFGALWGNKAG